ncbi:phosphatidylserine decarboxylase [Croceivirga thetidis]|uniref:Phosphatidylserine decarboxylase n=1 Tax=Croceivirga thetidis TaxID=2721623 RepID=A0ABX1GSV3_9FLAO|nr:phosphatidylserine decarboxylase [Croceivirga thetidis]NKI33038.1 phosphatidylserine decarboxylase [Croceivirga thetidis]
MIKKFICLLTLLFIGLNTSAQEECIPVKNLKSLYASNKEFKKTIDSMFENVHELPNGNPNPWKNKNVEDLYSFLNEWFYFLPNTHNGLDRILKFTFLYYKNPEGMKFVLSEPGLSWTNVFIEERGKFMDSPESAKIIAEWLADNSLKNEDFVFPERGFNSFNEFFTRDLKPGTRPIDDATDESILVSPADGIINMIANELELDTEIPTKGRMTMSLNSLLDNSKYAENFIGGSALAIFLMPDNYHHYHSPTTGKIVESNESVGNRLFGMPNMLDMINNGNVAYNKDYSVFEDFKHGYFIIETDHYGYIAMIPIGLQTVGSVVFEDDFKKIHSDNPKRIYKGEKLGHFEYGGSTVLLIFEKGKLSSLTVEQGQRIGKLKN